MMAEKIRAFPVKPQVLFSRDWAVRLRSVKLMNLNIGLPEDILNKDEKDYR